MIVYCDNDSAYHVGTVQEGLYTFEGVYDNERIKCRPVARMGTLPLSELPAPFRLLRMTGQQTIQRIHACEGYAALLVAHPDVQR